MSIRVMSAAWDHYPGAGSELLVLLAMADWSDDDGRCWPSMSSIALKTRLSRSQSQRVIHRLIADGYIAVTGNETGGAPGSTRQYQIKLDRLTGSTHATGSVDATGSTHAQEGSHPCGETGRTHATQTVIEPSMNRQVPKPGAFAPPAISEKQADPIFGGCLDFLKSKGAAEKGARSFLGLMRKTHGDDAIVQAIERAERDDITDPIPWLSKYLEARTKGAQVKSEAWAEGLL
jgi:hypothetical protein